jgi:5-methylcytosine-specific restriction endonuclease McrA
MDWVNTPGWEKELVVARDRGKCAQCKADITMELDADDHFDHMVPLSRGGCNDIVNLQLLCDQCNLKKSDKEVSIYSSIPPYLRRYHREK